MLNFKATPRLSLAALLLVATACGAPPTTGREGVHAVLAADDQRGTEQALATLQAGLASTDADVRAAAARALGRLERPEFAVELAAVASQDEVVAVRVTATHAVAQAGSTSDGSQVRDLLVQILSGATDPTVRGAAAAGLGRLRYGDPTRVGQIEGLLRDALTGDSAEGAARGLAALFRNHREHTATADTGIALGAAMLDANSTELARVAAAAALATAGYLTGETRAAALTSDDAEVRRRAVGTLGGEEGSEALSAIDVALADDASIVRLEALRALRAQPDEVRCARLEAAVDDDWAPMRLTAIDGLGSCAGSAATLQEIIENDGTSWHAPVHALVSLSRVDPDAARDALPVAAGGEPWQIRMYAARAAGELGETETLLSLASATQHPNVRAAALRGLDAGAGAGAGSADVFVEALSSPDYQLVMTAANALHDTDDAHIEPLLVALDRITGEQRETSRDPRMALLRALDSYGSALDYERLEPYLSDFDPEVVARVTGMVTTRNGGRPVIGEAQPLPPLPFPTLAQLDDIAATTATLRMSNGEDIQLRFFPFEAPTHAARFVRLAGEGYFDGLTLHRVVFNFVLQGGSPGANEYMGDGAYTRDEITARAHQRGTVGTSTRGRDTGDGQIFINLVDNLRLDFNYTIFAEVVGNVDAIDAVLEGEVIESITLDRSERP